MSDPFPAVDVDGVSRAECGCLVSVSDASIVTVVACHDGPTCPSFLWALRTVGPRLADHIRLTTGTVPDIPYADDLLHPVCDVCGAIGQVGTRCAHPAT